MHVYAYNCNTASVTTCDKQLDTNDERILVNIHPNFEPNVLLPEDNLDMCDKEWGNSVFPKLEQTTIQNILSDGRKDYERADVVTDYEKRETWVARHDV